MKSTTPEHLTRRYKKGQQLTFKKGEITIVQRVKKSVKIKSHRKPITPNPLPPEPIVIKRPVEENVPETLLNGGYLGLYGEVVTEDCYHLRDLHNGSLADNYHDTSIDFIPDVILDLGANIGIFSRYARQLFPEALIVAIEPNPDNLKGFKKYTNDKNIILIKKGIGKGALYKSKNAVNGSGEVYLSENSAFNQSDLKLVNTITNVPSIMLTDLKKYIKKGQKIICKIDIEGNETVILDDKNSMELLRTFDYITIELHYYGMTPNSVRSIKKYTKNKLISFNKTHNIKYIHPIFYATKYT